MNALNYCRGVLFLSIAAVTVPQLAVARDWTDSTGHYTTQADLIAFNDQIVILKKPNHTLVSIPPDKLSAADREYLASKEAAEAAQKSVDTVQTWTMVNGMKVTGKVVEYGRRQLTIQRRLGSVFVNDIKFDNLPPAYQKMVPRIVSHFEMIDIDSRRGLEDWLLQKRGMPANFTVDGVMLELESGDLYGVPFFFFTEAEQKFLQPGWERWLAAEESREQQEQQAFELQAQAQAYQQDRQIQHQMMQMQLQLQAYNAGLFSLWEVQLYPGQNFNGQPVFVVVPGRNSDQAAAEALAKFPGYIVGGIGRVRRM